MKISFKKGKIIAKNEFYKENVYHVSNKVASAIFNGKGEILGYSLANAISLPRFYVSYYLNGSHIDVFSEKTVEMVGRIQKTTIELSSATFTIKQFLDEKLNGVFTSYNLISNNASDKITVNYMPSNNIRKGNVYNDFEFVSSTLRFGSNAKISHLDTDYSIYFDIPCNLEVYTFVSLGENPIDTNNIVKNFTKYERRAEKEVSRVKIPKNLNSKQKALYLSAYFCSLENYKENGDFKGFMAGHHYLIPMRTYYRDSYYTVLPMLSQNSSLVKNEILTLARGISENGDCPSAVKNDFTAFWGNHFDSPSLFVMQVYDYVKYTGDISILHTAINGDTVLEKAKKVIKKLSSFTDETGLIYKPGDFNKRDWADVINRNGYVTYNEALYARALYALSKLCEMVGDTANKDNYLSVYELVKKAINDILWDDEKGYFINFKTENFIEDNLSIDTCFMALYSLTSEERALKMLKNMENLLESKNNTKQKAGDFGVMCVYPFYKEHFESAGKSSQPYHYHNSANWPYLSSMYALAKKKYKLDYNYALESWFDYNVKKGNFTPVEYFSPLYPCGSLLQAWSGVSAFVLDEELSNKYFD